MTTVTKNMFAVAIDPVIGVLVFCLTVATARKMGAAIIAGIIRRVVFVVFVVVTRSASSVSVAKDRRAVGVRYQRLARRADCNATTIATSGIGAYIGAIDK